MERGVAIPTGRDNFGVREDEWEWTFPTSTYGVNGQAILDGDDVLWVTSAPQGESPGCWNWPGG